MTYCTIIPTYNNVRTVADIVRRTLAVCQKVIVVNDGSTDDTLTMLEPLKDKIQLITYTRNRGKGHALRLGLDAARNAGYDYAATIDSDGQHRPEEIPQLVSAATQAIKQSNNQAILVVGSRNLQADGMPAGNTFANRFSNFWFRVQTGISLPDTQTGFRLYPLHHLPCLGLLTARYESELELLVFSAWRGARLVPVGISVSYPGDRVSHFRPFWDFFRISLLNTALCIIALVYGYPRMLITKLLNHNS
ncbi:MAG: glycosyltransferase family 2 protein [Bacteroidales bacterium]|nr:glycosyltransferase family 2 protein [Bacteroidales bacterium]